MTNIWKTCFTCLTCVVFPKFKILCQVTHLARLLCFDFTVMPLKVKINKNQQPFNRFKSRILEMKEDAVVGKPLLQDSGMVMFHMWDTQRNVLWKFIEFLWRRNAGVPSWGNNMAAGNQQTNIQDTYSRYSSILYQKIMKNPCKAKTCINKGVKLF